MEPLTLAHVLFILITLLYYLTWITYFISLLFFILFVIILIIFWSELSSFRFCYFEVLLILRFSREGNKTWRYFKISLHLDLSPFLHYFTIFSFFPLRNTSVWNVFGSDKIFRDICNEISSIFHQSSFPIYCHRNSFGALPLKFKNFS